VVLTYQHLRDHGLLEGLRSIWPMPTVVAGKIILGFALFEAALQLLLPGKRFEGPVSPSGNVPVYKANGLQAYAVTLATYLSLWWFGIFNPAIVYDHLGEIFSTLVFGSFVFCILLYIKGHVAPSSSDSGSSGNAIIDFYWGMELYPRIGKHFDIKVFTNCRFGMMSWAVLAVTYCIKQYEMNGRVADSMLVNTALMLIYITKFYWWESGYWCTMDIAHDRAGFYICWGCLVWVPSIYTSPGMYLVNHPVNLGPQLALSTLLAGILCIYINYDCDRQRQEFRRTNGKCLVWGKAPTKIVASYQTTNGETKTSLLLTSGWWGLTRHFHYVPEILSAFFWTVPALFDHFLPYFYVIFLTILLLDRAKRDDDRCSSKYGKYWKTYCNKVPYRVIPGIY
jgi:7-dehydrocholesterol reductase